MLLVRIGRAQQTKTYQIARFTINVRAISELAGAAGIEPAFRNIPVCCFVFSGHSLKLSGKTLKLVGPYGPLPKTKSATQTVPKDSVTRE